VLAALLLCLAACSPAPQEPEGETPATARPVAIPDETALPESGPGPEETPLPESSPEPITPDNCDHRAGFGADGSCLRCGWTCPHLQHDPEKLTCTVCGARQAHHFGMDLVCGGCGMEAPLATERLDGEWFAPAERQGQCLEETLTDGEGREHGIAVWLPWDYDPAGRYNVLLLIHGDAGRCTDWTDRAHPTALGEIRFSDLYDRVSQQRLCEPFMVVGLENRGMENPERGDALIRETVLPYLAEHYATWMEGSAPDQLRAARDHLAIGGLSRGSMYAYSVGMARCLDLASNFCCFSNGYQPELARLLEEEELQTLPIQSYLATVGLRDNAEYVRAHQQHYQILCRNVARLEDGGNARLLEIDEGHDYLMWSASLYDALLLMF